MVPRGDRVFVKITNEEMYCEIKDFRASNDRQHQEIVAMIAEIKAKEARDIEELKGQINLLKATIGGAIVLLGTLAAWFWSHFNG